MQHLFLPYDLALLAKEKGFDEPCFAYYLQGIFHTENNGAFNSESNRVLSLSPMKDYFSAPLYQQIIDWMFLSHDICISAPNIEFGTYNILSKKHNIVKNIDGLYGYHDNKCKSYLILNKAIEEAFKLINQ